MAHDTPLHIRTVRLADMPALSELVQATASESLGEMLPADELNACLSEYGAGRDRTYYVADADGELAGYAVAGCGTSSCGPVERLYVRRAFTDTQSDREVAEALVSAVCSDLKAPIADSAEGPEAALALYDRWGFVDVEALLRCLTLPYGQGRWLA